MKAYDFPNYDTPITVGNRLALSAEAMLQSMPQGVQNDRRRACIYYL